ncbi:MAG: hypothetical protein Q7J29_05365 [Stagnimonas sp.]|nr:hypothetical protein [Stagnimonas sp.]
MSLTAIAVTLALVASLLPLVLLARRDPKRLRSITASAVAPHASRTRQALAAVVLLPGAILIGLGYWPAFLIWLGGLAALGWLLVQLLAARR